MKMTCDKEQAVLAAQTVKSATQKPTSTQITYIATLETYRKILKNLQQVKETFNWHAIKWHL